MKVLPFQIPKQKNDALIFQQDIGKAFYDKLHQHEEIQICFIKKGEGTLIVGDTINEFKRNDIFVIGSCVPHVFKSDIKKDEKVHMISLFFTRKSFGDSFFDLEEMRDLERFFVKSKHGFKVKTNTKKIKKQFLKLKLSSKLERFIILLQLINNTSNTKFKSLSSFIYDKKYSVNEGNRMRTIFEYTMNNFAKKITLEEISKIANMTKNAFCKYFKKRTNKTYFQFLMELRIENACKLLIKEKEATIIDIAEQSGYHNISNFNRQFLFYKQQSPTEFKKSFHKN
ncbi:AraC family transcriptional regulator [uncultured Polaribacter sp.]|uniref:AraC family transcriptional regulator n=1 Tax=uncultured Polaribacter sp. TaxID=174711 RepID=UPI00261278CA|nr:AraC family transcriptional regulator [uncultured Polaribacter sp.]